MNLYSQETARRHQHEEHRKFRESQAQQRAAEQARFNESRVKESEYLKRSLEARRSAEQNVEAKFRERWKERNKLLWNRIESAIGEEEAKWREQQAREQKARDEEMRRRKEEEDKRKREEETRRKQAEEAKRKEAEVKMKLEEAKKKREAEEAEARAREQKAQQERVKDEGVMRLRELTGMYDSEGMWYVGLRNLNVSQIIRFLSYTFSNVIIRADSEDKDYAYCQRSKTTGPRTT